MGKAFKDLGAKGKDDGKNGNAASEDIISLELFRHSKKNTRCLGELKVHRNGSPTRTRFFTLEPGWNGNKQFESCIPDGIYIITKHESPKFGLCLKLHDVPGRSDILVHPGNFKEDTTGCILVGMGFKDIDKDGTLDVSDSKAAMEKLLSLMPDTTTIYVCGRERASLKGLIVPRDTDNTFVVAR